MSDEELARRIDAILRKMSEEDMRAMAREYPDFFTPEVLEKELERWRELQQRVAPDARGIERHGAAERAGQRR